MAHTSGDSLIQMQKRHPLASPQIEITTTITPTLTTQQTTTLTSITPRPNPSSNSNSDSGLGSASGSGKEDGILDSASSSLNLQWWQLIAISLAGLFALIVVGWLWWRHRKRKAEEEKKVKEAEMEEGRRKRELEMELIAAKGAGFGLGGGGGAGGGDLKELLGVLQAKTHASSGSGGRAERRGGRGRGGRGDGSENDSSSDSGSESYDDVSDGGTIRRSRRRRGGRKRGHNGRSRDRERERERNRGRRGDERHRYYSSDDSESILSDSTYYPRRLPRRHRDRERNDRGGSSNGNGKYGRSPIPPLPNHPRDLPLGLGPPTATTTFDSRAPSRNPSTSTASSSSRSGSDYRQRQQRPKRAPRPGPGLDRNASFRDSVFSSFTSMKQAAVKLKIAEQKVKLKKALEAEAGAGVGAGAGAGVGNGMGPGLGAGVAGAAGDAFGKYEEDERRREEERSRKVQEANKAIEEENERIERENERLRLERERREASNRSPGSSQENRQDSLDSNAPLIPPVQQNTHAHSRPSSTESTYSLASIYTSPANEASLLALVQPRPGSRSSVSSNRHSSELAYDIDSLLDPSPERSVAKDRDRTRDRTPRPGVAASIASRGPSEYSTSTSTSTANSGKRGVENRTGPRSRVASGSTSGRSDSSSLSSNVTLKSRGPGGSGSVGSRQYGSDSTTGARARSPRASSERPGQRSTHTHGQGPAQSTRPKVDSNVTSRSKQGANVKPHSNSSSSSNSNPNPFQEDWLSRPPPPPRDMLSHGGPPPSVPHSPTRDSVYISMTPESQMPTIPRGGLGVPPTARRGKEGGAQSLADHGRSGSVENKRQMNQDGSGGATASEDSAIHEAASGLGGIAAWLGLGLGGGKGEEGEETRLEIPPVPLQVKNLDEERDQAWRPGGTLPLGHRHPATASHSVPVGLDQGYAAQGAGNVFVAVMGARKWANRLREKRAEDG